ncbi:hypothetical protein BSK20_03335 [SR1 bacterium human oral taxon HOT-345]|nr:hypothetical protein BSK20_03335 [SR1 bacterium human oral taxon HOT-345]
MSVFPALLWSKGTQKDLRWLRYGQSSPRKTSAGFAMVKVVPERPPLASLSSKWSQKDLRWLRYRQSSPRKTSADFAMGKVVPERPLLALLTCRVRGGRIEHIARGEEEGREGGKMRKLLLNTDQTRREYQLFYLFILTQGQTH